MSDAQTAITLAIIVMLLALLMLSRSGTVKRPKDRFKTSKQVLHHARILEGLGNQPGAINILQAGAGVFPKSENIKAKLAEMQDS